jgi:hypothetical protein
MRRKLSYLQMRRSGIKRQTGRTSTFLYGSDVRVHNPLWLAVWLFQLPIIAAFAIRLRIAAR